VHLVGFLGVVRRRAVAVLCGGAFASAFAGIAAGFAIRFLWPALAPLKIAAFVSFEATLVSWVCLITFLYWPRTARQARPAGPRSDAATVPGSAGSRAASEVVP
jgi:hypothetical protein